MTHSHAHFRATLVTAENDFRACGDRIARFLNWMYAVLVSSAATTAADTGSR